MVDVQPFIDAHNNQPLEVEDASNLDQCFDLAFGWVDYLGIPRETIRHLYAYQIFTQASDLTREHFLIIPNTPDGVPEPGDIVVFGIGVGRAGHVSIAVSGDASSFKSFDQNWDTDNFHDAKGNPICRLVWHNYDYGPVLGWLRPKQTSNQGTQAVAETADQVEQRLLHGPGGVDEWKNKTAAVTDDRDRLAGQVGSLTKQVQSQQTTIDELNAKVSYLTWENAALIKQSSTPGSQPSADGAGTAADAPSPVPSVEPTPVKPSYKTSELYITAGIIAPLAAHLLKIDVKTDDLYSVLNAAATLIAITGIGGLYVKGRQDVKVKAIEATAAVITSKEGSN